MKLLVAFCFSLIAIMVLWHFLGTIFYIPFFFVPWDITFILNVDEPWWFLYIIISSGLAYVMAQWFTR
jgi:hypothetical protein